MDARTRILFLAASPRSEQPLQQMAEFTAIQQVLDAERFELQPGFELQRDQLQGRLHASEPTVVHFSGHGSEDGELLFQDASKDAVPADPEVIARVFSRLPSVRCVVLSACWSELQAQALHEHVDVVIAARHKLDDVHAQAFCEGFYLGVVKGRSLGEAFEMGKDQIGLGDGADPGLVMLVRGEAGTRPLRLGPEQPGSEQLSTKQLDSYRTWAIARHGRLSLLDLPGVTHHRVNLQELVVTLHATVDRKRRGAKALSQRDLDAELAGREAGRETVTLSLLDAFAHAGREGHEALILLGDPGTGKTTCLKQVLLRVLEGGGAVLGLPSEVLPVFLPLRELEDLEAPLGDFIQTQLQDRRGVLEADFGARLCTRGRLLLLFDGLDEIANLSRRAQVSRWLEQVREEFPDSYILVSCRYAGYEREGARVELPAEFLELHLRELDDAQMRALIDNCYAKLEADPERARAGAQELSRELSGEAFTRSRRIAEMTRNPLLLTGICLIHQDGGELPRARAELYEDSIEALVRRWRARHEQRSAEELEQARAGLRLVAHGMHEARDRRAEGERLEQLLEGTAPEPRSFLHELRTDSGLVYGLSGERYEFCHLGFQEYLAAARLRELGRAQPAVIEALVPKFTDSWWQEVIIMLLASPAKSAASKDTGDSELFDVFMRALVREPSFVDNWGTQVMQLCLAEASTRSPRAFVEYLQGSWWLRVLERLFGWLPALRRRGARELAAAKLLAQAMPEALSELEQRLGSHPSRELRRWARERSKWELRQADQGGVELVRIRGGSFMMGSPEGVGDSVERPQREVTLADFYIARTPVTNAQYAKYLEAKPDVRQPSEWNNRRYNQPQQPVVGVSWDDAQAYCDWAGLVLPTEAQWEYACRAGTSTAYSSGDKEEDLERVGWYGGNSGKRLHPAGEKAPNEWGLYDMHGNVWEWCMDGADSLEPYTTSPRAGNGLRQEPVGDGDRVMRGGCWDHPADRARSAYRAWIRVDRRSDDVGFRPAQGIS